MDVVLNESASLRFTGQASERIRIAAPIPKTGLRVTVISKAEEPSIFEVLRSILAARDVQVDLALGEKEFDRLREIGLLVAGRAPPRPKFCDSLGLVTSADSKTTVTTSSLSWAPGVALVRGELDVGFGTSWISAHASKLHRTRVDQVSFPVSLPVADHVGALDARTLEMLRASADEIRGRGFLQVEGGKPADEHATSEKLVLAKQEFDSNGFAVLPRLLAETSLLATQRYYRELVESGFAIDGDEHVNRRWVIFDEPAAVWLHYQLVPVIERVVGCPLRRTYAYFCSYRRAARLDEHVDRRECQFTLSLSIDGGDDDLARRPWPLTLKLKPPKEPIDIELSPCDAVLYRGCEIPHSRAPLENRPFSSSLLFHFVER